MVRVMLNLSHNDYAESLYRLAALKRGYRADWAGARANALDVLTRYGVSRTGLSFYDGSGLSRSDRMTVTTAVSLVKHMRLQSDVNSVVFASTGMPVAGVSGTLQDRFVTAPTSCAKGIVRAKTGTLDDVVTLSGIAQGKDGRERLFSILVNGNTATTSARAAVDALAATATGCY
jgi:D-alanyl-D-alanine carboxypeptidase/D-alanyl-D-alanine-endopeptidase (penicillin-binding protein 4)